MMAIGIINTDQDLNQTGSTFPSPGPMSTQIPDTESYTPYSQKTRIPISRSIKVSEPDNRLRSSFLEMDDYRGIWYSDERIDYFEILDERMRKNARAVPLICEKKFILDTGKGDFMLKVKHYGKDYRLSTEEPFYNQPVVSGIACSGVLVAEDIVATAAHFVHKGNVKKLFFIFDYKMISPVDPNIHFTRNQVYLGESIINWKYDADKYGSTNLDWTFVKLDRKVENREFVKISKTPAFFEQPVYGIGFPVTLPLKVAPGAAICKIEKNCFLATLDMYSGNSGSPIFSKETHELLGIVSQAQGDWEDFYRTPNGFKSMVYPNEKIFSEGIRCVKAEVFADEKEKSQIFV